MTFKLGLTGSIGMGKSTTAQMFAAEGCPVWDADAAVHQIYGKGGSAVCPVQNLVPEAVIDGLVSRDILRQKIASDPSLLGHIETIVHPLVSADRTKFLHETHAEIVVFDNPLLFETNGDKNMDAVACVTTSDAEQERRVMARGIMTSEQFQQIKAKQMPNADKVAKSDYVIETDTIECAQTRVREIIKSILDRLNHA